MGIFFFLPAPELSREYLLSRLMGVSGGIRPLHLPGFALSFLSAPSKVLVPEAALEVS